MGIHRGPARTAGRTKPKVHSTHSSLYPKLRLLEKPQSQRYRTSTWTGFTDRESTIKKKVELTRLSHDKAGHGFDDECFYFRRSDLSQNICATEYRTKQRVRRRHAKTLSDALDGWFGWFIGGCHGFGHCDTLRVAEELAWILLYVSPITFVPSTY